MKARKVRTLAIAALMLVTVRVFAHHSFVAQYDSSKPITLTGTVTKFEWTNPHARFYVDVKDAANQVTNWQFELGSPNGLKRRGWTRTSLKVGDSVTVNGYLSKDGSHFVSAREVTLSDGRKVFGGSADSGESGP